MKIEIGHKIKEVFDHRDMKLTDFADALGTVRQNVYRIFKKEHLDTGLLLKIGDVLNHNFFQYYLADSLTHDGNSAELEKLAAASLANQQQLDLAKKEIDYLRKIIRLMEEKAELAQQIGKNSVIAQRPFSIATSE